MAIVASGFAFFLPPHYVVYNTFKVMSIYIKLFSYACKYFVRDSITMIFYFHQDNDVSFKIDEKYHSYFWQKTFTKNLDLVRD